MPRDLPPFPIAAVRRAPSKSSQRGFRESERDRPVLSWRLKKRCGAGGRKSPRQSARAAGARARERARESQSERDQDEPPPARKTIRRHNIVRRPGSRTRAGDCRKRDTLISFQASRIFRAGSAAATLPRLAPLTVALPQTRTSSAAFAPCFLGLKKAAPVCLPLLSPSFDLSTCARRTTTTKGLITKIGRPSPRRPAPAAPPNPPPRNFFSRPPRVPQSPTSFSQI